MSKSILACGSGRDTRFITRPPTEPYGRPHVRLPPWVCDGEAIARPRMENGRFRDPCVRQLRHPSHALTGPSHGATFKLADLSSCPS